ncbi:MAG: hypothetical protein WC526_00885 [Patescibacteria group bacterium]
MKEYLFCSRNLSDVMEDRLQKMKRELEDYAPDRLLNTSTEDLVEYCGNEYGMEPVVLHEEQTECDQHEHQLDVSQDPNRFIFDSSRPFYVPSYLFEFFVPFSGDPEVLESRTMSYDMNPPRAEIREGQLRFAAILEKPDGEAAREQFHNELKKVRTYLSRGEATISDYNKRVRTTSQAQIEARKQRLLAGRNVAASLGYPMRVRADAPLTYAAPAIRRKMVAPPRASSGAFSPEPVMLIEDYEHILGIIETMVLMFERSPATFKNMKEEDLRNHILVQLNGHYEGAATGETFNGGGKTDILVRVDNRNVFIGECKFWAGPVTLAETIDQVFGYASWRDTKIAIILFNRNKDTSAVLAKIPDALRSHANFKRLEKSAAETRFRAVLHQPGDVNREVSLTVLVFDVPA